MRQGGGRKRPGRLWLFFWGRRRRGFPGLLAGIVVALLVLALVFRLPGGPALSRWVLLGSEVALGLLILGSLGAVLVGLVRPRRRR